MVLFSLVYQDFSIFTLSLHQVQATNFCVVIEDGEKNYLVKRDEQVILVVFLQGPIGLGRDAVNVATVGRGA